MGLTALTQAAFETLTEAGYQPEVAYFECLHELKLIVDLMYEEGIGGMRYSVSDTAEYGDLTRGPRMVDDHVRATMRQILAEVQSGEFATEWIAESRTRERFRALEAAGREHQIEQVGQAVAGHDAVDQRRQAVGAGGLGRPGLIPGLAPAFFGFRPFSLPELGRPRLIPARSPRPSLFPIPAPCLVIPAVVRNPESDRRVPRLAGWSAPGAG